MVDGISASFPGFLMGEELVRQGEDRVYRASQVRDGKAVLLKIHTGAAPSAEESVSLDEEIRILRELPWDTVLRPLGVERADVRTALVLEDPGGAFLAALLEPQGMEPLRFLELACPIAESLSRVHQSGVVHRHIHPHSIYVESLYGAVRLAGFGFASQLPEASPGVTPLDFVDGFLAYMAPEQTGRVNRQVDTRVDLYSLGVIFYRMLTGHLPFESEDPMELLHFHITRNPQAPAAVRGELPGALSDIVMKLIAKLPEDRYRSAHGLISDLRRCMEELCFIGQIRTFSLGDEDPVRLEIPETLHGRERDIEQLLEAFDRVGRGGTELFTVSGYSGIGKTSLVRKVQQAMVSAKGYFIGGKFDQLTRDEPYSALIQALTELVRQILTESTQDIVAWRERFARALGNSAQVVVDVVPELELVIGPQPVVPVLEPTESQNRLKLHFQRFVAAVARRDHPLVLFFDDLQWVDPASLSLTEALLTGADMEGFLLIGSYRDNEVDAGHPLLTTVYALRRSGTTVTSVELGPLTEKQVEAVIGDALGCNEGGVSDLVRLVYGKTRGNPFFARTFLETAFANRLIRHETPHGWTWDMEQIRQAQPTDNVVDLLAARIERLGEHAREALKLAACVGNHFDLKTIATVLDWDTPSVHQAMSPSLRQGLIRIERKDHYAFYHDRIQEAAYRCMEPFDRVRTHYRIGTLLLTRHTSLQSGERLFEITDHLNHTQSMMKGGQERLNLARLNLEAGAKARRSAAFSAALAYFDNGIQALGRRAWAHAYELAYPLHLGRAECAFLCGESEVAEADVARLLRKARSALERAPVYTLRMVQYENTARFPAAVTAGKSALGLFGLRFPRGVKAIHAAIDEAMRRIRRRIGGTSIGDLAELPRMRDPEIRMCMHLLMTLWAPTYISGDKPLTVLIAAKMVELSLEHGNTEESAYGYVTHAITLGAVLHNYRDAYEFGLLALEVNQRFNDLKARAKVNHMFSCYIGFWRRPITESFPYSQAAYDTGLESGDFVYAAYGCFHESWHALFSGWELERFNRHYSEKLGFLKRIGNRSFYDAHQLMLHWGLGLQGRTRERGGLSSERFDENGYLERYLQVDFFTAFHHIAKLNLLYTLGDYAGALGVARRAQRVSLGVRGMIWDAWLCFYHALALTALNPEVSTRWSRSQQHKLDQLIEQMGLWAHNCPHNFAHQHSLLCAEKARIGGRATEAIEHYEAAVEGARDSGFIQHQALAKELYAGFWLARGNVRLAQVYMSEAVADFARWGASDKVRQLTEQHPELVGEVASVLPDAKRNTSGLDVLDSVTVVGAARAMSDESDSGHMVEILLRLLVQSTGAQCAMIFSMDDGKLLPQAEASAGGSGLSVRKVRGEGWQRQVAQKALNYVQHTRQSLVVGDARQDERLAADPVVIANHVKSILCVPLLYQGTLEGILYLENGLATDVFTTERLNLVESLATQAAIFLNNTRLFLSMQAQAAKREKAESRLRAVAAGTAGAVGEGFYRDLVLHLAQALRVRIAFVTECADIAQTRVRALAFVDQGEFVDDMEYELRGTPCQDVIDGDVCFYPDRLEERFSKEKGLAAYLGVPIRSAQGGVLGHLAVVDDEPMEKSSDDESLLRVFAIRAGAELERQRAQEAAQRSQLMVAEQQRLASIGEFASMIVHEIRSPLSTVGMALEYLQGEALSEKALKRLKLAGDEKQRLQSLMNDILLFAKPQQLSVKSLDLDRLLHETVEAIQGGPREERRTIQYVAPSTPIYVTADRDKLKQVLINLLSNACQAITMEQKAVVSLAQEPDAGTIQIQVCNPGHIPDEVLVKLSEPFFTTKAGGTGLGLAIVKRIVEAHGGRLKISCDQLEGVRATVTLAVDAPGES